MSVRNGGMKMMFLVWAVASVFVTSCATQPQPEDATTAPPGVTQISHPDREPTKVDVEKGAACRYAIAGGAIAWIEDDRTYSQNGYCRFKTD